MRYSGQEVKQYKTKSPMSVHSLGAVFFRSNRFSPLINDNNQKKNSTSLPLFLSTESTAFANRENNSEESKYPT